MRIQASPGRNHKMFFLPFYFFLSQICDIAIAYYFSKHCILHVFVGAFYCFENRNGELVSFWSSRIIRWKGISENTLEMQ